jgi:hypothetical protein
MSEQLIDQIAATLNHAKTFNVNVEVAPVVLLWPDRERQFGVVVQELRSKLPILTLGDWDESKWQGPAYWVRCAIAGTIDADLGDGTPVLYLPGVGRNDLRAIETCPRDIAPIAELQYRGQWFAHPNGKDWTVRSLLSNRERGLGLEVADDPATGEALVGAFDRLLSLPMRRLASQYIDADFLQRILNPDPVSRILEWLDEPSGFRSRLSEPEWKAFLALCRAEYDLDPAAHGEVTGGRLLGERRGAWSEVWKRFMADPARYSGVEARLRMGRPNDQLFSGPEGSWPQDNEDAEESLRGALTALADLPASQVAAAIHKLRGEHKGRRTWVWATLGRAPLATALEHLNRLTEHVASNPALDVDSLVHWYADVGWQADEAYLAALRSAPDASDRTAVAAAATALYRPWVDTHARALQQAIGPMANAGTYTPGSEASTAPGVVTVFVDGLRLDVAHQLADELVTADVAVETSLTPLPTVTDTAKPALTPVPDDALAPGKDLGPARASSGAKANAPVLRSFMAERGLQVLQGAETGDPAGCAWTEAGDIDGRGHQFHAALADELDGEVERIARRVRLLLQAGWKQVDVVTDHGWLLIAGGLEKVDLPAATVELRKGRCARLKPQAAVQVPTVPWHWDNNIRIALAPGAACFERGKEYEHGGVSLQECVVPRLRVRPGETSKEMGGAAITRVKWLGLMCRVEFDNVPAGTTVDIRALPADARTSVASAVKETTSAGKQSLHVADEELEGEKAYVVIEGQDGAILAQREVTIGMNR